MPTPSLNAQLFFDEKTKQYTCKGDWTTLHLQDVVQTFLQASHPSSEKITLSGKDLHYLDSAGALALLKCVAILTEEKNELAWLDFTKEQQDLLTLVKSKLPDLDYVPPPIPSKGALYKLGKETVNKVHQVDGLVTLVGDLTTKLVSGIGDWRRFQFPSIVSNIYSTGITALPILALLSFLIGVVLAYQMGLQLETYGASVFIAYLSGMAIFREFAPLITAIIVAGRTSSAFTAQIGSMKINEEIDALYTMGLSPTELLVVPKVLGLLFIFPLLIFWADLFGTAGSMIMSKYMLNVGYHDFLVRLQDAVGLKQLKLGLYKAPSFAVLIALVGCFQGFRVGSSADSVGSQTTKSVVQALFLIIVTDATYSIIYSWLDW